MGDGGGLVGETSWLHNGTLFAISAQKSTNMLEAKDVQSRALLKIRRKSGKVSRYIKVTNISISFEKGRLETSLKKNIK